MTSAVLSKIRHLHDGKITFFQKPDKTTFEIIEERRLALLQTFEDFIHQVERNEISEIDFSDFFGARLVFFGGSRPIETLTDEEVARERIAYVVSDDELVPYVNRLLEALVNNTSVCSIRFMSIPMDMKIWNCTSAWERIFSRNTSLREVIFYSCGFTDKTALTIAGLDAVKSGSVSFSFLDEKCLSGKAETALSVSPGVYAERVEAESLEARKAHGSAIGRRCMTPTPS